MHRLCFVLLVSMSAQYVAGNLIREIDDVLTRDVPLPEAEVDQAEVNQPASVAEVAPSEGTAPDDVVAPNKSCAQIGEFCTYHSECCTNACLGYLRRCVSGSG